MEVIRSIDESHKTLTRMHDTLTKVSTTLTEQVVHARTQTTDTNATEDTLARLCDYVQQTNDLLQEQAKTNTLMWAINHWNQPSTNQPYTTAVTQHVRDCLDAFRQGHGYVMPTVTRGFFTRTVDEELTHSLHATLCSILPPLIGVRPRRSWDGTKKQFVLYYS